ncbi:hypothetical protein HPB48_019212 [Haemaphysalis longicornis]|uniref:CCHC-type domain-containing protein n=1 Tax=Haemaphysalis longicornis TaxID=44386 RepID=A0A9J6GBG0_HAELO|nr:hypothetical protein HPB48_019212 [Haemaphysalis longicornis]
MDCDVEDTENMDNTHHEEEALEKDDWVEQRRRRNKKKKSQSINPDVGSPKPDITSTSRSQIKQQKRLPPLPRDDYKIIIRPRGALKLSNLEIVHLSRAVAEKTQHGSKRTAKAFYQTRVDEEQSIAIVSTPDEDLARNIRDLQSLHILSNDYEITAYIAAPDDSSRGVVHGIPPGTPISELIDNLHAPGYEILTARMLGKTSTALVTFAGKRVPRGVIFEHAMLSCSLYRPTRPVCYVCHEVGHRADVCPNPDTVKCAVCGLSNPAKEHECTPRCVLCKGAYPTGDKRCPERLVRRSPKSPQTSQHQSRRDTFNNDQSRSLSRRTCRSRSEPSVQLQKATCPTATSYHGAQRIRSTAREWQVPLTCKNHPVKKTRLVNWDAFRKQRENSPSSEITNIEEWVRDLHEDVSSQSKELTLSEEKPAFDPHLLHLCQARRSMLRRWRRQKLNRRLKIRIAKITEEAAKYASQLMRQNWNELCNKLYGTLGSAKTWALLRNFLEPTKSRSATQNTIKKIMHQHPGTNQDILDALRDNI